MKVRLFDVTIRPIMRTDFKRSRQYGNGEPARRKPEFRNLSSDTLTVRADTVEQAAKIARRMVPGRYNEKRWRINQTDVAYASRETVESVLVEKVELVAEED